MTYFDTDVLVNAFFLQDENKQRESKEVIELASRQGLAAVSVLSVQETLFTLGRLRADRAELRGAFDWLMQTPPIIYDLNHLHRAYELAATIGFQNINDCIHTAIAETHCTELVTYNRRDFNRLRNFARVSINIL